MAHPEKSLFEMVLSEFMGDDYPHKASIAIFGYQKIRKIIAWI